MPLIFVHGVAVRDEPGYQENVSARTSLFKRFALNGLVANPQNATILNPYWGKFGAKFLWNYASLPGNNIEKLGSDDQLPMILLSQAPVDPESDPESVLLRVARKSLREAIDMLWAMAASDVPDDQTDDLAELAVAALEYARQQDHPAWLDKVTNDQQFLRDLRQEVKKHAAQGANLAADGGEVLGLDKTWDKIREGASRLGSAAERAVGDALIDLFREGLNRQATRFIGDVFTYLKTRGTQAAQGPIVQEIVKALETAKDAGTPDKDEKLIVVAHSMGGNIVYDILTYFRPDIKVDVLVTVGSQVAMFEELKLFPANEDFIPVDLKKDRVAKPANVGCWLNVFDLNDTLGYAVVGVFANAYDFRYSTGAGVLSTHSTYFTRPSFHERLGERIRSLCL